MAKKFQELKPGDKIWYTFNLKDFSEPEQATVKDVIINPDKYLMKIVIDYPGMGTLRENETIYCRKNTSSYDMYHTSKELAVQEMLNRWQKEIDEGNEYLAKVEANINNKIENNLRLINNLKQKQNLV